MIGKSISALCAAALLAGVAAAAQPARRPAPKGDANRQVCRTFAEPGSRLVAYRACHTKAEWAEMRRQTVANIDRIQNMRAGNGR